MNHVNVRPSPTGWGYCYSVNLPIIGGPRHGQTEEFHLVMMPSAGALTAEYRMSQTLDDGRTRWDIYAVQRNEHEPVALTHVRSFIYDPREGQPYSGEHNAKTETLGSADHPNGRTR